MTINLRRHISALLVLIALPAVLATRASLAPAPAPAIEATELYRVSAPLTLGGSAIKVDGAGDLFAAAVLYNGNDTQATVKEYAPSGATLGEWPVVAPSVPTGYDKWDSISLAATGHDLLVEGTSHFTTSNRDYLQSVARIPGVYTPPEDGPGAGVPGEPASLSDQDIARIADAVATRLQPQYDRVIGSIQPKVEALFNGSAGSYILWRQLTDTSYQGAVNALRAYAPPVPTPAPASKR